MGRHLFIRDDDAWTLDRTFRYFFDLARDHDIPVVYAVIPGRMDKGMVRFLRQAKEKTPGLLDIVQHGWVHANHSPLRGKKYEFGASRPLKLQREDIRQGLERMRSAFGDLFIPAFVPPYHGYDERTLQVLREERFRVFSAGSRRPGKKAGWVELPAEISFSSYDQDGPAGVKTSSDVAVLLARSMARRTLSGVLTHHADFTTAASRKELARFFSLVNTMRSQREWRVLLFSDLCKE